VAAGRRSSTVLAKAASPDEGSPILMRPATQVLSLVPPPPTADSPLHTSKYACPRQPYPLHAALGPRVLTCAMVAPTWRAAIRPARHAQPVRPSYTAVRLPSVTNAPFHTLQLAIECAAINGQRARRGGLIAVVLFQDGLYIGALNLCEGKTGPCAV